MRKKAVSILMLLTITMTGCLGSKANKPVLMTLPDGKEVYFGWVDQRKLPSGYWVLLQPRGSNSDEYEIINIAEGPLFVDIKKKQELLYVDKDYRYVQPFFLLQGDTQVTLDLDSNPRGRAVNRGTWECQALGKYESYSPCTSNFMKVNALMSVGKNLFATALTFGLASGTHKTVDSEKVKEVATKLNLFAEIDQWKANGKRMKNDVEKKPEKESVDIDILDLDKLRELNEKATVNGDALKGGVK